ncbi:hypothetical protein [Bradyrhizobium sp. SZCCHNRI2007]|uniref:hypothetical protein n=1 Tax=Bradyrhizobium sp. SZCCHNRI2007 TaxID=3057281 RepID=UPI0028F14752|nr:hypothetical protein [Bradyrhizobium sp. SZCCHNRI2007]
MVAFAVERVNDTLATSSLPRFRFADDAESKAFGPAQHIRAVHPANAQGTGLRRGSVVWWRPVKWTDERGRERNQKQWSTGIGSAEDEAEALIANGKQSTVNNLYFSMQAFRRPNCRKVWNLAALGCCFVDIDYKIRAKWSGQDPRIVMRAILAALDDAGIPAPSFAMDSGNGIHIVWNHNLVPPAALKRWNLVQERLLEALQSFGADPAAKDAARVLRLSRSWNPAARDPTRGLVHLIWIQGTEPAKPYRYDFDSFADEILPFTRAEIVSLRAERAKRNAEAKPGDRKKGRKPVARRDSASYAETVLEDLHRLREHRYRSASGRLPSGTRDAWLFVASMALSWITPAPALQGQVEALACKVAGWRECEARSRMGSIVRRALDAAAGKTIEFDGKEVDPRYRMKVETIIKWLAIKEDEMRAAGLRVLLSPDARRERKAQDACDRRKATGATSHDEKRAERIALGKRATWMHVRNGLTYTEIAAELGVSKSTIGKAIEEARSTSLPTSQNARKIRKAAFRAVYGGINPPKGGLPVPGGTGCSHPGRSERKDKPFPTEGCTISPHRRTPAASGGGTGAEAPQTAQRLQGGQRTVGARKTASSPTRADRSDQSRAPERSTNTPGFRRPAFLNRKVG